MPDKLMVSSLFKRSDAFVEPDDSLLCTQVPATCPRPESDESNTHLPILCLSDLFQRNKAFLNYNNSITI